MKSPIQQYFLFQNFAWHIAKIVAVLFLFLHAEKISAQSFTPGYLTVLVTGDGSLPLSSAATPISVVEYTTSGAPTGVSVVLPSTGLSAITNSGTATSEGLMELSAERDRLIIAGYAAAAGTPNVATSTSLSVPRVLYAVNSTATYSQVASTSAAYSGNNIRSGTSFGGNYFAGGPVNGAVLMNTSTQLTSLTTNIRAIQIINGQTYFTSDVSPYQGVSKLGSGIPTTGGSSATLITPVSPSPFNFSISPDGNTIYIADDLVGIQKYTFSGGTFVSGWGIGMLVRGLTVDYSGAQPIIYVTTASSSPNAIFKITDDGSSYPVSFVAMAPVNTVFRGITFSPGCFATLSIPGSSSLCTGDSTNVVIHGNPYGTVSYTLNGAPHTVTLGNNGIDTLHTGALTTAATYTLISISTPSCSSAPLSGSVTVTVNPYPPAITGVTNICFGSNSHLFDALIGGLWHSNNPTVANVNAITGVVLTHIVGTDTVTYTSPAGCKIMTILTVNPLPSSISGIPVLCAGTTTTLSNGTSGGIWSSSNPAIATIGTGSGIVSGITAGIDTITYATGPGCTATQAITVNPLPAGITGVSGICAGSSASFSDPTSGGSWSSTNNTIATIGSGSGLVSAVAPGIDTIIYTLSTGCFIKKPVTVNSLSTAITGTFVLCTGANTTLSNATPGGSWSSSMPSIATVGTGSGLVSGISSGTASITFTGSTGCYTTQVVTVNPVPPVITGDSIICSGSATTLSDATSGGSWSSTNSTIATVIAGSGLVTGVSSGIDTIIYTLPAGCLIKKTISVNPLPAVITGSHTVCTGNTTTLSDASPGGAWSSSTISAATVGSGTGVVTGVGAGNTTITYTSGIGCYSTFSVTVNSSPAIITGGSNLCSGSNFTLSDATTGGTWSSTNLSFATVIPGGGVVTGVSNGIDTIVYTLSTGCLAKTPITVYPLPAAISGSHTVCKGSVTALIDITVGGLWTSADPTIASIGSVTGVVTGINAGNTTVTYTSGPGCIAAYTITVNNTPAFISGDSSVCVGSGVILSDVTPGGSWSSNAMPVASIGTGSGAVTGVSYGIAFITYTLTTGCYTTRSVTVNSLPATISGILSVCAGAETNLFDASFGGRWKSGNPTVATIDSLTGLVSGISSGNAVATYSLPSTGCYVTSIVTVNPVPSVITGPSQVCTGSTGLFTDSAAGGTWTIGTPSVATVGSSSGIVSGVSSGSVIITYMLSTGCKVFASLTIQPQPDTIAGTKVVCTNYTSLLTNASPGGAWTSSNTLIATAGSATGIVTGNSSGIATIRYTLPTGCFVSTPVTVNPTPPAVSGDSTVCTGASIPLTDAVSGGVWSSGSPAIATVGSGTGLVNGITTGVAMVTYTQSGCYALKTVTVNSVIAPGIISGPSAVCIGDSILLTDTVSGGIWSRSNTNATISAIGRVKGINAGLDTITYSVTNICGTTRALKTVTINTVPNPAPLTGAGSVCVGAAIVLTDSLTGGTWSMKNTNATVSNGLVAGIAKGTDTCVYTVTNSCGSANVSKTITITTAPDPGIITGPDSVCKGSSITLVDTVSGGVWASISSRVSVFAGVVTGISTGVDTIIYIVTNSCGTKEAKKAIKIVTSSSPGIISGPFVLCAGTTILLTDSLASGGTWSATNAVAKVVAGHVTGMSGGVDTIKYTVANGCGNAFTTYVVTVNPLPDPGIIYGYDFVCLNYTDTLRDSVKFGVWSCSNGNVTVNKGIVTGKVPGTDTIFYAVTNACGTDSAMRLLTINDVQVKPKISRSYNVLSLDTVYKAYQWQELGHNIPGATNSTYTMITPGVYEVIVDGYYGCKGWDSMQVRNLNCDPGSIFIYPNPTRQYVNINWCGAANVRITRMDGTMYQTIYNVSQIDMGELPPNIYLLCFFDEDGKEIRTFRVTKLP